MKLLVVTTGVVLATTALGSPTGLAARELCNALLGGEENPPVVSDGTGRFRVNIRDNGTLAYRLRYDFPDATTRVTAAHLHVANPGANGGIAAFLCPTAEVPECGETEDDIRGTITSEDVLETTTDGTVVLQAGDLAGLGQLIEDGAVYANVHTDEHPDGELRCQINPRER